MHSLDKWAEQRVSLAAAFANAPAALVAEAIQRFVPMNQRRPGSLRIDLDALSVMTSSTLEDLVTFARNHGLSSPGQPTPPAPVRPLLDPIHVEPQRLSKEAISTAKELVRANPVRALEFLHQREPDKVGATGLVHLRAFSQETITALERELAPPPTRRMCSPSYSSHSPLAIHLTCSICQHLCSTAELVEKHVRDMHWFGCFQGRVGCKTRHPQRETCCTDCVKFSRCVHPGCLYRMEPGKTTCATHAVVSLESSSSSSSSPVTVKRAGTPLEERPAKRTRPNQ